MANVAERYQQDYEEWGLEHVIGSLEWSCGCYALTTFGSQDVLRVMHCKKHQHLYSSGKTNLEMLAELYKFAD